LKAIVEAAEQEQWLPVLRIVAGNTLFFGTPGPASKFHEKVEYAAAEEYYNARGRILRKQRDEALTESTDHGKTVAAHVLGAVGQAQTGDILTLYDCQVWPASGGDGVKVAAVRIPLDSVDGWWPGSGDRFLAPSKGGGWLAGFGILIPVEID